MSPLQQNMVLHSQEPVRSIVDQVRSFELNAVASGDVPWIKMRNGRQIVEMTIDSGAAATVVPRGAFDAEFIETLRTRTEVFATASGHRMPNYGEQRIRALSTSGTCLNITAQVTDVRTPPVLGQEMVSKGNHVIFKADGPNIRNCKTGVEIPMIQRGRSLIELEIATVGSSSAASGPIFSRPESLL